MIISIVLTMSLAAHAHCTQAQLAAARAAYESAHMALLDSDHLWVSSLSDHKRLGRELNDLQRRHRNLKGNRAGVPQEIVKKFDSLLSQLKSTEALMNQLCKGKCSKWGAMQQAGAAAVRRIDRAMEARKKLTQCTDADTNTPEPSSSSAKDSSPCHMVGDRCLEGDDL